MLSKHWCSTSPDTRRRTLGGAAMPANSVKKLQNILPSPPRAATLQTEPLPALPLLRCGPISDTKDVKTSRTRSGHLQVRAVINRDTAVSTTFELIRQTLVQEFSDFNNVGEMTTVVVRLVLAALLGGLLGLERESQGKAAGIRTHMLVCIGAALFILIPRQAGISDAEMSRVIQGVIAGIGFLCAGAILKGADEQHVTGLTTAAGIWLTAAIGVAVGLGRESTALLCTLLAWIILNVIPRFQRNSPEQQEEDKE